MSRIFISNPSKRVVSEIDSGTLVSVIKGTCITSVSDSDRYIELRLTEGLLVHIENSEPGALRINLTSTLNRDEIQPVRVQIVAKGENPSAALVEHRLYNLRQVYAIIFLLNAGREKQLAAVLHRRPNADLEKLLREKERLYLIAGGPGTWWFTLLTKVKGAGQKTLNILSLLYGEGREMLLRRVRAETEGKEAETAVKKIDVEKEKVKLKGMQINAAIDTFKKIDKIKNRKHRAAIKAILSNNSDSINPKISGLFPPPNPEK